MTILEHARELLRPYYLRWVYFPLRPEARPAGFAACWTFPSYTIRETPRPPEERPGVIFYPMNDWHGRFQRTQHLAVALARQGYRCLYLNPHLGRQFEGTGGAARQHRIGVLGGEVYELHVRLPREPVFHHRLLTADESDEVREAVAAAVDVLRMQATAQVVSFPVWYGAAAQVRGIGGAPVIYDCHDLLSGFGNVAPELVDAEPEQMRSADRVVFSSKGLWEEFAGRDESLAAKSAILRNGVDAERFRGLEAASKGGGAVYAGALDRWFDVEALRAAARANPNCRIVLIGRVDAAQVNSLRGEPNIEFRGEVEYARLPAMLAESRVGLIPFQVNELTMATNPIKLYEYFGLGMPVVSSALPEVMQFGDLVYLAKDGAGFGQALSAALEEDNPERRRRRREVAMGETWDTRAQQLLDEIGRADQAPSGDSRNPRAG